VSKNEVIVPYERIRDELGCGDMLCCDHKRLIWKYVGHTASVYQSGAGQLQVLESTAMSYTGQNGVQLHPMGEWLARYPGQVSVRKLLHEGSDRRHWTTGQKMELLTLQESFIRMVYGTSYPNLHNRSGRWKLILARLDFELFGKDRLSYHGPDAGIFCTQLKVMELSRCGLMTPLEPAQEYEPRDTRDNLLGGKIDRQMNAPWSFGPEIRIK
jgi:hypothetical protein